MKIEFEFDRAEIEKKGYQVSDITNLVKRSFSVKQYPCVEDGAVLAFTDNGNANDFCGMWAIITKLINTNWFSKFTSACRWFDDEETEAEDVLAQAWKLTGRKLA